MGSPLDYSVIRTGLRLNIKVSRKGLRFWLYLTDKEKGTDSVLWYVFSSDSIGRDLEEALYFAKVLLEVLEKGGSAQFTLGGVACSVSKDERKKETPFVLEVGVLAPTRIFLRKSEAEKIRCYFCGFFS